MKKRFLTCAIATVMAFSMLSVSCGDGKEENTHVLTWENYSETEYAYVSEIYYYDVPKVQDEAGTSYEVFVEVADKDGKEVDNFGGFFLVEKPEEYKVTYSVDDGKDVYSKTTTVVGIEKAAYELANAELIYSVNDVVSLDGKVKASQSGDIIYSVTKGEKSVPLENNSFKATETGVYTVHAQMDKQPTYSFDLYVVSANERPYADGLILDGANSDDIVASTSFEDFSASISFDESKKYDSMSNGSYKIEAKTTGTVEVDGVTRRGVAAGREVEFSLKPAYSSVYYKALERAGYKYVAIRYMIEKSEIGLNDTTRFDYISGSGKDEMAIYYDGRRVVNKTEENGAATYTFWQNNLQTVPNGAWAEMLLDISKFTTYYADTNMTLFRLVVNKNCSWDLTMYIDNVYAVKEEVVSTTSPMVVDKGTTVDLSTLSADTAMKNPISTVTLDGTQISVSDNKLKVDDCGVYSIEKTDRTMYGGVKQEIVTKGTIVSYATPNFSAKHNTDTSSFVVTQDPETKNITIGGAGKIDAAWRRTTYTVKTLGDKAYYEDLQASGFNYITYEFTLNGNIAISGDIYRLGLTSTKAPHWNSLTADNSGYSMRLLEGGSSIYDTGAKASGNKYLDSQSGETWRGKTWIISIHIADFINLYNDTGMNILTLQFVNANAELDYSVTFGRIQATKEACKF